MSKPLPKHWWATLGESDRLAFADAVLDGELSHDQWCRLREAGIAGSTWDATHREVERYLPAPYRRLVIDWVREAA
jgi:hypothetical protein